MGAHDFLALATTFAACFVNIALRAFQQRNVAFDRYAAVLPTSLCLAVAEVYVIARVASSGFHAPLIVAVGLGSGTGAIFAMWLHKKVFK